MTTTTQPLFDSISASQPQVDLYTGVHKGLRWAMCTLLTRMGAADFRDATRVATLLDDLEGVLYLCESHVAHEERHIHPALERRCPGYAPRLENEHREHDAAIRELRVFATAVAAAPAESRGPAWRALYLRYSKFVSENLAHMVEEETEVSSSLASAFSAAELNAIHDALLGSIGPDEMMAFLRVMVPGGDFVGRIAILSGAKAAMPPAAFDALLRSFRPTLGEDDWRELASSFALAA